MPRVALSASLADAPLSVAAAAAKLGVAPATLRTWDRRYGLSPSERTAAAHRRYTAVDMARLQRMVALCHDGISACDAAKRVLSEPLIDLDVDVDVEVSKPHLVAAARAHDRVVTRSIIDAAVARDGLVASWEHLIAPALQELHENPQPEPPGMSSLGVLLVATRKAIVRVVDNEGCKCGPARLEHDRRPQVLVISAGSDVLQAEVFAAALLWQNVPVKVISGAVSSLTNPTLQFLARNTWHQVVLIDSGVTGLVEGLLGNLSQRVPPDRLFAIGSGVCPSSCERATCLHSLTAAVSEVVAGYPY